MLEILKKISETTNESGSPTMWFFGKVTAKSPLTIRVDSRFDIGEAQLVVPKELRAGYYITHKHTGFKDSPSTVEASGGSGEAAFASHSHTLKNTYQTNTDETSEYYYGLDVGDKVILLRNAGGQQFLVLGRV
jgi:hypothetical protein